MPLLSVNCLGVRLGTPPQEVVREVSFELESGNILGIAGESGSGKSVTALSLTRLLPPTARPSLSGEVALDGMDGNLLTASEKRLRTIRGRRIAYVFQEPSSSFNPVFTIGAHLAEASKAAGFRGTDHTQRLEQALGEVGISPAKEALHRYPGSFSGGMLQRAALACALIADPDILVADEPTTALDMTTQRRLIDLLVRLNEHRRMALIFISHDLGLLREFTNSLLIMKDGEIVERGPSREVLEHPQHPYTQELIRALPRLRLPPQASANP